MGQSGFTIIELMGVTAIIAILLCVATLQFNDYSRKSSVENQTRVMLTDLMTLRSQAMFEKRSRAVKLTATTFAIYSSDVATGTPTQLRTLTNHIIADNITDPLIFDTRGVLIGTGVRTICIEPSNNPGISDSLVVSTTRIQIGKRSSSFAGCDSAHITTQ